MLASYTGHGAFPELRQGLRVALAWDLYVEQIGALDLRNLPCAGLAMPGSQGVFIVLL